MLPPGINRAQDPTQPQLVEANEQALNMVVTNLGNNESKAVYKNTNLDLRQYRRLFTTVYDVVAAYSHVLRAQRDVVLVVFLILIEGVVLVDVLDIGRACR